MAVNQIYEQNAAQPNALHAGQDTLALVNQAEAKASAPAAPAPVPMQAASAAPAPAAAASAPRDYTADINSLYDAQREAQLQQLNSARDAAMAELDAARARIAPTYNAQGNDLAAQYERQRAANNEAAAANGLNTGAGSQMQIAQSTGYQNAYGKLRAAQANAEAEIDRQRALQETQHKQAVAQALRDNDYNRALALMQENRDAEDRGLARAQLLAQYGDFSGFAGLPGYGQEAADWMQQLWIAQNPDLAYRTGRMTADDYRKATGKYPTGYSAPGYGVVRGGEDRTEDESSAAGSGISADEYRGYRQAIAGSGNLEATLAGIPDSVWNSMTDQQYNDLMAAVAQRSRR